MASTIIRLKFYLMYCAEKLIFETFFTVTGLGGIHEMIFQGCFQCQLNFLGKIFIINRKRLVPLEDNVKNF